MTQQDRDVLAKFSERLANIEVAIMGNGTRGLAERMKSSEAWQQAHEVAHQLFSQDIHEYRQKREGKEAELERKKAIRAYAIIGSIVASGVALMLAQVLFGGG